MALFGVYVISSFSHVFTDRYGSNPHLVQLGQPHVFSKTPLMTNAVPICRRFAVDLSRSTCLEFLEFVHFNDGRTVVFCRQFLLTADYTLPVIARAALYSPKSGSKRGLGTVLMKAAIRETANCPSCLQSSENCSCSRTLSHQSTTELRLNHSTWTQYASSFVHKSRKGMCQMALFASVPQVGDVELYNAYVHSLTVVRFGESRYMSEMQRKAVHGLNVDVLMPRLNGRINMHAIANDWERAHENFVKRKKRYLGSDEPYIQHPTTQVVIQDPPDFPPLPPQPKSLDLFIPSHLPQNDAPLLAQFAEAAKEHQPPLHIANTTSSNETEPSLDDVAAISAIVDSTIDASNDGRARVTPPLISPGFIDSIVTGTAPNTSAPPPTRRHGGFAATTLTSPPVPRTTSMGVPLSGRGISATSNLPALKRTKLNHNELDGVDNFRPAPNRAPTTTRLNAPDSTPQLDEETTKPHCCTRCNARFKARGDLARHVLTVHEGKKVYTCTECGKTFGHSGHLNRHKESVHQKRRRHKCTQCGDSFFQASHLQSHVQHVHDRRKPWACHLCALRLATENGLRNHLRNLHNAKADHKCPLPACEEAFLLETDLNRHLRRGHSVPKNQLARTRARATS